MANEKRLIYLDDLLKFPIRITHYDMVNGNRHFVLGIEFVLEYAENLPTVDAVEVVRCKDCEHSYDGVANLMCGRCGQNINGIRLGGVSVKEEHFCSYGERKGNE